MSCVCDVCGRSNYKTKYRDKFEMTLCDSCLLMCKRYKFHYIPPLGEIHYDEEGNMICHVCGRSFKKLSEHIRAKHHMTNGEYKKKFELNRTAKLTGTNFTKPIIVNDITEYSRESRFKPGHKKSSKTRRLQALKNRAAIKKKTKKY